MYGDYKVRDFFWGALVGGAVGTLTTLLFTTKKGRQIRNDIIEKYNEFENEVKENASDVKDNIEDTADHAAKKMGNKLKKE